MFSELELKEQFERKYEEPIENLGYRLNTSITSLEDHCIIGASVKTKDFKSIPESDKPKIKSIIKSYEEYQNRKIPVKLTF